MGRALILMMVVALACGCAGAAPDGRVAPAAGPAPIADQEPDVTAQVSDILAQYVAGSLTPERYTERAGAALLPDQAAQTAARLRAFGELDKLELLARSTDGEDRLYRYRARYRQGGAVVDITFSKGGRIARLAVRPE
ncbi:MAG: hypothetical protein V4754_00765 [Pseudomonadota bacterium]